MSALMTHIRSVSTERRLPTWRNVLRRVLAFDLLSRERGYLDRLDAHALRDIGLTRADIDRVLSEPGAHLRSILTRDGDKL